MDSSTQGGLVKPCLISTKANSPSARRPQQQEAFGNSVEAGHSNSFVPQTGEHSAARARVEAAAAAESGAGGHPS